MYRQCVAGMGWWVLRPIGDHLLQEFINVYLTRFRTYKIPNKNLLGEGALRQINTYPLQVNYLVTTFCFGVYIVN